VKTFVNKVIRLRPQKVENHCWRDRLPNISILEAKASHYLYVITRYQCRGWARMPDGGRRPAKASSGVAKPNIWRGNQFGGPKVLTLGEKQYFFGTPPLKAQND